VTDWSELRTAYGTAEAVPAMLASAEAGDESGWDHLWSHLCHQGTVYSGSFAALPELARLAGQAAPAPFSQPLYLAAMIAASGDRAGAAADVDVDVRHDYASELARMRDLAEHNLSLATELQDVAYAAHCLAALEGIPVWEDQLDRLGNGETDVECPACAEDVIVDLDEATAAEPTQLDPGSARVYELLAGFPDVAASFLRFAGTVPCTRCGTTVSIPESLA
jgi:hypothetical protein